MPTQPAIATNQRRNLILEAIRRLSQTRSWVTQRDLLADLKGQGYDVQKHHVLRDLKALSQIHSELECHNESDDEGRAKRGVEFGYRWIARDTTPETGLSIPEALSLVLVSRHLKQALPNTLAGALEKLFERAEVTLELQQKNGAANWKDLVGIVTPSQPMLPPKINNHVTQVVHQALISKELFMGVYRNSKGEQDERRIHPLGIMLRGPSIYLIGIVDGHAEPRMFALHRFISAKRLHLPGYQPDGFCLKEYLEEQGNFGDGKWVRLKALVNPALAMIIGETPLGINQQLGEPNSEGWCDLSVRVRDNWQFRWWLLAQGERILVLSPSEVRDRILKKIAKVNTLYEGIDRTLLTD